MWTTAKVIKNLGTNKQSVTFVEENGSHIEGHCLLCMIEDVSEDLRLEVCPDNVCSAAVLVSLIKEHIELGTTIHTDYWGAYDCLAEHGYSHKKYPDNPFLSQKLR